ncbi:hypothetical protein N7454_001026 [Penicillium verhagenii]|nr:hypothetical protein N7454_001026 [Penicillium verhagenii]
MEDSRPERAERAPEKEIKGQFDARTLSHYDMVLSISTEAINKQFKNLWQKRLPRALPDLRGGEFPLFHHLIAHDLWLFPPEIPDDDGAKFVDGTNTEERALPSAPSTFLKAHIGPPRIQFHPSKQRIATITVDFLHDEDFEGPDKDSILQYWVEGRSKRLTISGWQMSWEVEITQEVIDNPDISLLQPAKNPIKHIVMEQKSIEQLEKHLEAPTLSPSHFTVAAIFCRISSSPHVPGTFQFTPPEGVQVADSWPRTAALAAIWMEFRRRLAALDSRLPTPQNPFVLGYSLTQKVPDITDLNSGLDNPSKTPPYFVPRECHITTTAVPGDVYTSGTLNFCFQTNKPDTKSITDVGAGIFESTFFNKLTQYGGPGDPISNRPSGHDGIMAISSGVFQWWLEDITKKLVMSSEKLFGFMNSPGDEGLSYDEGKESYIPNIADRSAVWKIDFKSKENKIKSPRHHEEFSQIISGNQTINVKYSSDFQKYNQEQMRQTDLKRQLYLNIEVSNHLSADVKQRRMFDNEAKLAKSHKLRSSYEMGYTLTPGLGGIWTIQKDAASTNLPAQNASIEDMSGKWDLDTPGYWEHYKETGCQLWSQTMDDYVERMDARKDHDHDHTERLREGLSRYFSSYVAGLNGAFEEVTANLANTIIMPLGNVVNFKNLDTEGCHLYTSVDFSTLTGELKR